MCGIVGYIGQGNAKNFVIGSLKKLEYRGYDSWGVGFKEKGKVRVFKETGKIGKVNPRNIKSESRIGIGHTRWATHGAVTSANAHPHIDCSSNIAVVHNGIINNWQKIKEKLQKLGHRFLSETDTEVIPHLVEEHLKSMPLKEAFRRTINELEGNFAICLISKSVDKIYLAANGCPLVIGLGKNANYISSDTIAFAEKTREAKFLKDGTIAEVSDKIEFFDIKKNQSKKITSQTISSEYHLSELGTFKHFLIKEINEQPAIIAKIAKMDQGKLESSAALIRNSFGTFFVACGTAYHAAMVSQYLFAKFAKMHVNTSLASEFPHFANFITDKTLLFAISQSGETADVLEAVKSAKNKKAKVISLINNPDSALGRLSNYLMVTPAGREIAVLSTKAYTAQLGILFLLSWAVSGELEKARNILVKAALGMKMTLSRTNINKIQDLARKLKDTKNLFAIGRGLNYPTALEAALKIKEVSYIHAEGFAAGELKHGTIALIEKDVPCIVFVANDDHKNEVLSNAEEIKTRGGYIIGVAPEDNKVFDYHLKVADIAEISPIVNIIPIQVLAYYLALEKGLDPDKPRNLAKSVTVK